MPDVLIVFSKVENEHTGDPATGSVRRMFAVLSFVATSAFTWSFSNLKLLLYLILIHILNRAPSNNTPCDAAYATNYLITLCLQPVRSMTYE